MTGLRDYIDGVSELLAERGIGAVPQIARLVAGKLRYRIGAQQALLFDLPRRPLAEWPQFIPTTAFAPFFHFINNARGMALFRDKVVVTARCLDSHVPCLPIMAVVGRKAACGQFRMLESTADVLAFLGSAEMPDEIFMKPAGDLGGAGAYRARRVADGYRVDDAGISSEALADMLLGWPDEKGMLIQRAFHAPMEMAFAGGAEGLPTLRVQTAMTGDGPELVYIIQKIIAGEAVVDNFSAGAKGNLIAAVDIATGRLGPAYGLARGRRLLIDKFTVNPLNSAPIEGHEAVAFDAVKALALSAAQAFPEVPLLALDIAVTDEGAMVVETNHSPDQLLPQIALGRGTVPLYREILPRLAIDDDLRQRGRSLLDAIAAGKRIPLDQVPMMMLR